MSKEGRPRRADGPHYSPAQEPAWYESYGRRFALAVAAAFVLHAVIALFAWYRPPDARSDATVAQRVTIEHRPTPAPRRTPRPTPEPTQPPTPVPTVPATRAAIAPPARKAAGGSAAAFKPVVATQPPAITPVTPSFQHVAVRLPPGSGSAGGTGAGTAGAGNGTGAESGSGAGGGGNGEAGGGAMTPCGKVYLSNTKTETRPDGSELVAVHIAVRLRDGKTADDDLHWVFVYANDNANPFSPVHQRGGDFPTLLQLPPSGYDLAGNQRPWTVFAVQHTRPDGYTDLPACPADP